MTTSAKYNCHSITLKWKLFVVYRSPALSGLLPSKKVFSSAWDVSVRSEMSVEVVASENKIAETEFR